MVLLLVVWGSTTRLFAVKSPSLKRFHADHRINNDDREGQANEMKWWRDVLDPCHYYVGQRVGELAFKN
uniref:Putative secreted protein n=1 Tax=Anopheles darlingi TaxID=43151 RepID=A0A2M4DGN8_ANODA